MNIVFPLLFFCNLPPPFFFLHNSFARLFDHPNSTFLLSICWIHFPLFWIFLPRIFQNESMHSIDSEVFYVRKYPHYFLLDPHISMSIWLNIKFYVWHFKNSIAFLSSCVQCCYWEVCKSDACFFVCELLPLSENIPEFS